LSALNVFGVYIGFDSDHGRWVLAAMQCLHSMVKVLVHSSCEDPHNIHLGHCPVCWALKVAVTANILHLAIAAVAADKLGKEAHVLILFMCCIALQALGGVGRE
jgi:hypothetical protein